MTGKALALSVHTPFFQSILVEEFYLSKNNGFGEEWFFSNDGLLLWDEVFPPNELMRITPRNFGL